MNRTETLPCANCDTLVAPDAVVCPGCGERFSHEPPLPPEALLNVVRIAEYADEMEAGMAQGILAEAGIDSFLTDAPQGPMIWEWRGRQATVQVREDRAESALAVLAAWQALAADEPEPDGDSTT